MRAQSTRKFRYYRESSLFGGLICAFDGQSVRADEIEAKISKLVQSLVLPENWQTTLHEMLNCQDNEIDPNREKARIKGEIRRMREGYKRGLYEGDEHTFWREIESLQMHLNAIEQLTPHEVQQAGSVLANLQNMWHSATPDEKQELCSIILEQIVYDFENRNIVHVQPKSEYEILFKLANYPLHIQDRNVTRIDNSLRFTSATLT